MISKLSLINIAISCLLVLTTIGFAQVNYATLALFPLIRVLAVLAFGLSVVLLLLAWRTHVSLLIIISIFTILYPMTVLRSPQLIFNEPGILNLLVSFSIILGGVIALTFEQMAKDNTWVSKFLITFVLSVLLFLITTGGIALLPVPSFHFDLTLDSGAIVLYDQGITKFFGLAAISAFWMAINSQSRAFRWLSIILVFIFIPLSFIGGGRGDFLSAIIVIALISLKSELKTSLSISILVSILIVGLGPSIYSLFSDTTAVMRFERTFLEDNYGQRDILFFQGLGLLYDNLGCLLLGCGFGYFQHYYNYPYGLYPHNIALESIITWGLLFVVPLVALIITGIWSRRRELGILFWVGVFFLLIGLKSGDVTNSWFAMSFIIYLAAKGAEKLRTPILRRKTH